MSDFISSIPGKGGLDEGVPEPFALLPEMPDLEAASQQCSLVADEIEDIYPCTPFQEGLMAITARQKEAYIAQITLGIPDTIDVERLKHAWEHVMRLCPVLRTRIALNPLGRSMQVVTRCGIDWQIGVCLSSYLEGDLAQSMDYGRPLTRFAIINDENQGQTLVWTVHHALYDGWSIRLLFNHVERIYHGTNVLVPAPFSSFIGYQQDLMKSSDWKVFWHRQLVGGDYTPWPEVPSQTTVNANQTIHQYFDLQHTSRHGVAVSSLLRAAWAITLSLHASSERVIFAEILSGRDIPLAHATEVVGAMLSTVPMGVKIDFSLTVEEFLSQIQLQVADIMEYQHAGLQNIHRLLLAEEHQMPPLNNMFMIQPREASGDDTDSLELAAIPGYAMELGTFDTFPVNVQCTLQEEEAVDVQVAFDGEIVSLETMNHVLAVFVHLSRELAAASGKVPLGSLNTVPAADLALIQRYQKPPPSPVRACIHHIIENHVRQTPEATALHGYDGVLTYAQLWDASDSLAESLIHAGVNRGILVPLCFEKSVWAIVAMVAVLKAGGACVNLDSSNPFGRIETIVRDTEAKLIVTSPTQRSRLEALAPTLIAVDGEFLSTLYHRRSPAVERISSQPGDAAFLIYTSGSTGKPKAVINTHQALASSAAAHGAALDIGRQTRAIQFASYAFDSSIQDIATVLQRGGCICVISETDRTSNFAAAVRIFNGNYALLTTSVASLYTPDDLPSVRTLQLGGEPMRKSILQAWCGHARVMNTYGPAECSINVTCAADMQINDMESNIGVPVGCRCWVVQPDNADQLVPLGCIGELLVEGPILAKGYLHDPEKTRSVFISPPQWRRNLGIEKCERLYRTGDLVFQSKDGCFHYAGRKDAQVKLNGQRLEVEEIESLIQQHSTITQAAVVLPKAGPMSNRLVAIMVLCKSNPAPVNDLRIREVDTAVRTELVESILRMLTQSLPESIRVSYFLPVWDLPLTISRKMDRGKMRRWLESLSTDTFEAILSQDTTTRRAACGPRNPMEAAVLDACVRVLNLPVERIDMQRSFFGVGGDSIGAIQLASQLRAEGVKITVPEILQARSLAAVAEHAKEVEMHSGGAVDEPDNTLFGLSPIQQWYFSQQVPDTAEDDFIQYFNQSVYGTLASHVEEHDLRQAISALVEHHPMLRARFQLVDGIWQQAIRPTSSDAFTWRVHELAGVDEETLWVLAENSHTSLDLVNGSVFSVDMINFSDGRQSLLLIAHHLVVDIVSWTILLDDLEGLLQGKPILLQEQASFQSWCRRKFDSLRNSSAINKTEDSRDETNIEYWGSIPCGQRTNAYQKRKIACVDRETTSLVLGDANRPLHTEPVDLFLSAVCASFMNAFNDRHGLTVFIEGHGRDLRTTEFDLSRTVGWFTTVASLSLIDRSYNPNLASVAQTIKDLRKLSGSRSEDEFARRYMQLNPREREQPKEFLFNYHGMSTSIETNDTLFRQEYPRPFDIPDQGPDVPISALFEIGVAVVDGVSEFTVYWPEQLLYQDQIVAWIDSIPGCLRLLATRLMQCKTQYYSLSDFPLLNLDNARLARLQERVLPRVRQLCRAPIQDVLPCSSMQDGILLAQAKQEKNYQTVQEFEICPSASGQSVDLHRLAEAWKQVVLRHPSLRTVFVESVDNSSAFSQVVLEAFEPDIVCVEAPHRLKGLSTVNYSELRPPHRLALAPADSGTVACSLELSHAIMDAASASIIVRDWTQAYEGAGPQPGRDCQLTYVEFIKQIRAIPHQKKLKYWTTYLANVEPCHFPPGPVARSSSPQCHTAVCEVNRFETARIRQFCAEIEVSPATLFQAAWALVLSQYVGTRDVCFGYLASGRDGPVTGIKDAVGAFINMLICRVQFSTSQMTASQFIQNLQQHSLEHLKFQHCTLAEIHHALGIPHGRALFNTIMSIQGNDKDASLDEQSNSLKFVEISGRDPHEYALSIGITSRLHEIQLSLDYVGNFISTQQASSILTSLRCGLMSMVDNPDASVADMSLLAEQGLAAIQGWNGPFPLPHESCVHTLIDEQARCIPEASAISSFEGNLSYGELEDLSNRLAQHLVLAGVKLEHIVPLCFDKSTCAVVSMLAVLKAGGACLSMSPTSPARYLRGTLAEVQASIILVAPQHADLFRGIGVRMLIIDNGSILNLPPFRQQPSVLPRVNPTNAAFVVCTSGSTATPKKIVLEHAAVVTSSQAHGSVMGITASSRVLQFSAYTFDVSIQDIFTTWQRGGCVCIISDHERLNDLAGAINARQANFADFTPTVAALIQPSTVPCLKTISVGGEAVPRSLNELWEPYARVINMYGPAEVTINTAYTDQGGRDRDDCQAALIGRPLASWFWVINSNEPDRLVPIGCVGELLIEGPLLAREYLNDVQKTEAAFIINPKWSSLSSPDKKPVAKRRMYRTGDLVRLNHNGTYTYIGRKDRQVKLYGQRVELGEIEHQLMQLVPNDVRVVVEAIGAPLNGEKQRTRLVAFLEWSSPSFSEDDKGDRRPDDTLLPVDNDEIVKLLSWLRESLQELLPPYMLPSLYVPLRNFPTTASGKLDRKRLSDFVEVSLGDKSQMSVIREKLAPMTDAQKTIHALIASLLSLSPGAFGINDSFFTLGGDSVDAIMLAQEARQQGLRISVADILRHPRIHEMAQLGEVVLA